MGRYQIDDVERWLIKEVSRQRGVAQGSIHGLTDAYYYPSADQRLADAIGKKYGVGVDISFLQGKTIRDVARVMAETKGGEFLQGKNGAGFSRNEVIRDMEKWLINRVAPEKNMAIRDTTVHEMVNLNHVPLMALQKAIRKKYKCELHYNEMATSDIHEVALMIYYCINLPESAYGDLARCVWRNLCRKQRKSRHCLLFGYAWLIPVVVILTLAFVDPTINWITTFIILLMMAPFIILGWWQLKRSRKLSQQFRNYRIAYYDEKGSASLAAMRF